MPLELRNIPATFQEMMDRIFKHEAGSVLYMYDMLICGGEIEAEHQAYVKKILQQCVNHELAVNPTTSEFHVHETICVCHMVNGSQV